MKKLFPRILILFTLPLFLILASPVDAASTLDQSEYVPLSGDQMGFWYIKAHTVAQTFKPTYNKLDKVYVFVNGNGSNATVTLKIIQGGAEFGSVSAVASSSELGTSVLFDFSTDLSVTPDTEYSISLTTTSNNAYWRIDKVGEYTRGTAIVDGTSRDPQDFGFRTYGYNAEAPMPDTPQDSDAPPDESAYQEEEQKSSQPVVTEEKKEVVTDEDTKEATKSATKSAATSSDKSGGFLSALTNPFVFIPLILLLVIVIAALVWFFVKRKKSKTVKPEIKIESPKETEINKE